MTALSAPPQMSTADAPRILVVDDEPVICAMVRKTLQRANYHVETTTQSIVALRRLEQEPFDLLITDINMPEMNGLELAQRSRALQALLGVVIMTAYGSFENMAQAVRAGVADFILKPFDLEELRLAVARAIERQHVQRDNIRLQTLMHVFEYSRAIHSTLDLDALYNIVTDLVARETPARIVALWATEAQGRLGMTARVGETETQPVVGEIAQAAHRFGELQVWRQSVEATELPVERLVAVPLIAHAERLGALVAVFADDVPPVQDELLEVIAHQTALALRNARQYAALRELDQLKSEFIGIASHELRTPLSLVLGYSSLLRHRLQGPDRESLQRVIDGALRMSDIIDDLIQLHRADVDQLTLNRTNIDIWAVLRDVVAEFTALAGARHIKLLAECPSQPVWLAADREKLLLALANLVDNALKFTEPGGRVLITGRVLEQQAGVEIEVCDTGIGIERRDLERIFARFYQVAPSTTRVQNGLGLGLALTQVFIELHGGQIEAQSRPGEGSVFRVHLPLAVPDPASSINEDGV